MISTRPVLAGALVVALSSGCAVPAFTCDNDAQCAAEPEGGRCEADHLCSYPDGECDSGRRYGEYAGDRSRKCVDDGGTSSGSTNAGTLATLDTAASESTIDPTTSTATTTTSSTSTTAGESSTTGNLPAAPLGHWPLDDNGPVATDISGNEHHGARDGGTWIDGIIDGAIQFSVEDHGIDVGTDAAFDLEGASGLTVMGWARFEDWSISNVPIVAKFGAYNLLFWGVADPDTKEIVGVLPVLYLYPEGGAADGDTDGELDHNGAVRCYGAERLFEDPKRPTAGASLWHHYAGTYDVATRVMVLYVDGVEEGTTDASVEMQDGTIAVSPAGVQLGRWQSSGPTLLGAIDDVRIYDVALGADEIAVIAAQGR